MDKLCIELEGLSRWLAVIPAIPICYAEAGVESDPRTSPNSYVELLFMERGRMRMEVGDLSVALEGGMVVLMNAHFGNRGMVQPKEGRYACVSFEVAGIKELAGLGRSPVLLMGRVRDIGRVVAAYQEVCRLRHSPPRHLPEVWMKSAVLQLMAVLYEELMAVSVRGRTQKPIVAAALRVLADRQSDTGLTLTRLAKELECSPSHLGRVFQREMGVAPMGYLAQLRVRRAQHLLMHTRAGVKEIAFRVGLKDPLYFSRLFRKTCGMSPRAYRNGDGRS